MKRRTGRVLAAASLGAAMALAVPTASSAERDDHRKQRKHRYEHDDRHDRHDRHDRYDRHDRHRRPHRGFHFGWGWGFGHRPQRHYPVHHHGPSCGHPGYGQHGYHCRPCGSQYGSLHLLHQHVHHHHHVPLWKIPFVIVAVSSGYYFYG